MKSNHDIIRMDRRRFLINAGRFTCGLAIGGIAIRILGGHLSAEEPGPGTRYVWAINYDKCTACGKCETHCVRKPSAVKAVNDQKKCSYCVACSAHIKNTKIAADRIMTDGIRVCKQDAVVRTSFSGTTEGYFIYTIDHDKCTGCGLCVKECLDDGSKSLFLIVRPDLCLNCNSCAIAKVCPDGAFEKVFIGPEDDYKGFYVDPDEWGRF